MMKMSLEQPEGLPRGDTLPDTDGEPLDSEWVADCTRIYLIEPLRRYFAEQRIVAFVGGNSFVYYPPGPRFLGPDFYVVRGGCPRGQTKWVSWEEGGLLPTTVIEFLSPSTESRDRGEKFCIYRDVFQAEDYFLVDEEFLRIEGFTLNKGHYVALNPGPDGWYYARSLGLFLGIQDGWVRLRTPDGQLLTTGREAADLAQSRARLEARRADDEARRADEATHRAALLAAKLRSLGVDPSELG